MDRRCLSHFAVFFISSLRTSFLNWYTQAKYIDKNVSGLVSKDKRKREDFCQSSWKFFRYLCCSRQFLWFLWYTFFFVYYDTSITGGYSVIKKKLFLAPYRRHQKYAEQPVSRTITLDALFLGHLWYTHSIDFGVRYFLP